MARKVVFAPEALDDLRDLYDYIADAALPERALAYVEGLQGACLGLADFPERGTRRDSIRPGLRTLGYPLAQLDASAAIALEPRAVTAYSPWMEEPKAAAVAPADWRESLKRSKAQIAAGEAIPLLPVLDRLRAVAERIEAEQGHSMEAEARRILQAALEKPSRHSAPNLYERIRARIEPLGGVELELPPRGAAREPPRFA